MAIDERPIPNFPNYMARPDGSIRSLYTNKILKQCVNRTGYLYVTLHHETKQYNKTVHRLILQSFVPAPNIPKPCARHMDGNQENNKLSNLAWGSHQDNSNDAKLHGTNTAGERNPAAKINWQTVNKIRILWRNGGLYQYEIANMFSVSQGIVGKIVLNKLWYDPAYDPETVRRNKWQSIRTKTRSLHGN